MKYITTCCKFIFYGMNHSPNSNGVCRCCGGVFGCEEFNGGVEYGKRKSL